MRQLLALTFSLLVVLLCVESATAEGRRTLNDDERALVLKSVKAKLLDPYSAVFESEAATELEDGRLLVCGLVNAKNRMGGYDGLRPYLIMLSPPDHQNVASLLFSQDPGMQAATIISCRRYGLLQ